MSESLTVPRLKVRKFWYKGLNPDPNDHSHPDLGDGPPSGGVRGGQRKPRRDVQGGKGEGNNPDPTHAPVGGDHQVNTLQGDD